MPLFRANGRGRLLPCLAPKYQQSKFCQLRWANYSSNYKPMMAPQKAESSDIPAPNPEDTSMIEQQDASQDILDHRPDYHTLVDHGTS